MLNEILFTPISIDDFKTVLRDCIKSELSNSSPQPIQTPQEDLITESEARDFLRVSKVTLKKWRDNKKIPYYRIESRIRYKKSELLKLGRKEK